MVTFEDATDPLYARQCIGRAERRLTVSQDYDWSDILTDLWDEAFEAGLAVNY